jgi:hypothetical protein
MLLMDDEPDKFFLSVIESRTNNLLQENNKSEQEAIATLSRAQGALFPLDAKHVNSFKTGVRRTSSASSMQFNSSEILSNNECDLCGTFVHSDSTYNCMPSSEPSNSLNENNSDGIY